MIKNLSILLLLLLLPSGGSESLYSLVNKNDIVTYNFGKKSMACGRYTGYKPTWEQIVQALQENGFTYDVASDTLLISLSYGGDPPIVCRKPSGHGFYEVPHHISARSSLDSMGLSFDWDDEDQPVYKLCDANPRLDYEVMIRNNDIDSFKKLCYYFQERDYVDTYVYRIVYNNQKIESASIWKFEFSITYSWAIDRDRVKYDANLRQLTIDGLDL